MIGGKTTTSRQPSPGLGRRAALILTMPAVGWAIVTRAAAQGVTDAKVLPERALGAGTAPLTVVEYASLTCKHCQRFHMDVLPAVKQKFIDPGRVRFLFRHFPLDRVALEAAVVTQCVDSSRFFSFIDALFQAEETWAHAQQPRQALIRLGTFAGMSREEVEGCLNDEALVNAVVAERQEGERKFKINSTPTFVVGTTVERGFTDARQFVALIERELARIGAGAPSR